MIRPILFNTDMVRAILEDRKVVTRRVVKPRYYDSVFEMFHGELCEASPYKPPISNGDGTRTCFVRNYVPCVPQYRPGDILYVRETFCRFDCSCCEGDTITGECLSDNGPDEKGGCWRYRASRKICGDVKWHPSIHMTREAARIFLRVTDVRVERLQDITEEQARKEGAEPLVCWNCGGIGCNDCAGSGCAEPALVEFRNVWNTTIKNADRPRYGWEANPWIWVIEFERISREEAHD